MPQEIHNLIAESLSKGDQQKLIVASKHFNKHYAGHVFKDVRFCAVPDRLSNSLQFFIEHMKSDRAVFADSIRGATIHIWSGPPRPAAGGGYEAAEDLPIEGFDPNAGEEGVLPALIVSAIDILEGLQYLDLDVQCFHSGRASSMATALRMGRVWTGVKYLRLRAPDNIAKCILGHKLPDLEGLHLHVGTHQCFGMEEVTCIYKMAREKHPNLKRLKISVHEHDYDDFRTGPITLFPRVIKTIANDFRSLEWLRIDTVDMYQTPSANLDELVAAFIKVLGTIKSLERLSITIGKYSLIQDYLGDDGVGSLYNGLLERLGNELHGLLDISVLPGWPEIYRGVRAKSGQPLVLSKGRVDELSRGAWPLGLSRT